MRTAMRYSTLACVLLLCGGLAVAEGEYKKYAVASENTVSLELKVNRDEWTFTLFIGDAENTYTYPVSQVHQAGGRITCGQEIEIDDNGFAFPELFISTEQIRQVRVERGTGSTETILVFLTSGPEKETETYRRKKSDIIAIQDRVVVDDDDFVRGSVISFYGDVDVYGEVNKDVVAIFGEVFAAEGAVIRGDVTSVNGSVRLQQGASVYGDVRSSDWKGRSRRFRSKRWRYYRSHVNLAGALYYNRIDGATFWGGLEYEDTDSIIPSFRAMIGYGLAAERVRYDLTLVQTLIRGAVPLQVGGKLFRKLKSDDDKIISEAENSLFAVLVKEDWKDYYEAEGAYAFARVRALDWNELEIGYLAEEQHWLDAHHNLWSLFGDDKEFRDNFSSVPYDTLVGRWAEFDNRQITSLVARYTVDTRDDEKHPREGWYGFAGYEHSPADWKGDFDFSRFETRLKRFQPLGRYVSVHLTGAYGHTTGDLIPLSRLFYLGGLGTLHGFRHKQFIGTEYVMVSGEYRFRIPGEELTPFIQYDGGKILDGHLTGDDAWYGSIGIGIDLDRNMRLFLSKRLDDADADPIFYARFSAVMY